MPNPENMMFVRPRACHFCEHGYNAVGHMVAYSQQKGLWNITDVKEAQANKDPVYNAIDQTDPFAFYGFGHGNNCAYTGDSELNIFTCNECDKLSGRVVYLLSCLTAGGLGPEIINQGALAYAGFNVNWTWIGETDANDNFSYPDPYNDPYAYGFYESANELWKALVDGKTFQEAIMQSRNKYDEWIDYWYYTNPEDPVSQDCIMWLAHDRDGLVGLDVCDTLTSEEACGTGGCYWYDDCCHSSPVQAEGGTNWLPIVLAVGVMGLAVAYYVQAEKAKTRAT